ncbi:MAG: tetratricopeptide repeat protein, partial [Alphaproteobacteria bacterium]
MARDEARGVVARRHLRGWILRRGARGAWRDRRMATLLASAGRRWTGATDCLQLAALMHLGAGRPAEAVALFDEAVARGRGGWSSVRFDLGTALMRCGELERAETELLEACRLTGNATWAEYEWERCRILKGLADEFGQQIEETERVEAEQPGRGAMFSEALRHAIPFLPRGRVETLRALVARRPHATEAMLFLAHVEAEQDNLP